MVKRRRRQSHDEPNLFNCLIMVEPYSSRHLHTSLRNSSLPKSCLFLPALASFFSTTFWVAMPAWSVPGIHKLEKFCILFHRIRISCKVLFKAWPIWRMPVTFGGGITMVKGFLDGDTSALNKPSVSHLAYMLFSNPCGLYLGWISFILINLAGK